MGGTIAAMERVYTTPLLDKLGDPAGDAGRDRRRARGRRRGRRRPVRSWLGSRSGRADITDGSPKPDTDIVLLGRGLDRRARRRSPTSARGSGPNGAIWVVSRKGKARDPARRRGHRGGARARPRRQQGRLVLGRPDRAPPRDSGRAPTARAEASTIRPWDRTCSSSSSSSSSVVLIWRGPKTLPKIGQALGRGVREARTEAAKLRGRARTTIRPPDPRRSGTEPERARMTDAHPARRREPPRPARTRSPSDDDPRRRAAGRDPGRPAAAPRPAPLRRAQPVAGQRRGRPLLPGPSRAALLAPPDHRRDPSARQPISRRPMTRSSPPGMA